MYDYKSQIRKFKRFKRLELINAPCKKESLEHLVEMLQKQTSLDTLLLTNISENLKLDLHPDFKVRFWAALSAFPS